MSGELFADVGLFLAIAGIAYSITLFCVAFMRIFNEESKRVRRYNLRKRNRGRCRRR